MPGKYAYAYDDSVGLHTCATGESALIKSDQVYDTSDPARRKGSRSPLKAGQL
jgi:hypothetical protein